MAKIRFDRLRPQLTKALPPDGKIATELPDFRKSPGVQITKIAKAKKNRITLAPISAFNKKD